MKGAREREEGREASDHSPIWADGSHRQPPGIFNMRSHCKYAIRIPAIFIPPPSIHPPRPGNETTSSVQVCIHRLGRTAVCTPHLSSRVAPVNTHQGSPRWGNQRSPHLGRSGEGRVERGGEGGEEREERRGRRGRRGRGGWREGEGRRGEERGEGEGEIHNSLLL